MILQSLCDYYWRKANSGDGNIAPQGWEKVSIPFVIVLENSGEFVDLEDTRLGEGARKAGRQFLVPQSVKRTVKVKANLLWDNSSYV
ncbi:MAG TPA: type I-C CRISPR-associated protein Cas8c/Csd1, partial [Candidatus Obscuribacterales bacterium]